MEISLKHGSTAVEPAPAPVTQADTGLGTTYERWALNRWLDRFQQQASVRSVLEAPDDGMTGIAGLNSLPLALSGAAVTLLLPHAGRIELARQVWQQHAPQATLETRICGSGETVLEQLPFEDASFDLVWNFNVMTRPAAPEALLGEMTRVSRKWVLLFVPNRSNYSFWLHRLHHRASGEPWDHGRVDLMAPAPWQRMLARFGLKPVETVWVDCPWWPDIVDFGQLISDFVPPLKRLAHKARPENRLRWEPENLPYYRPGQYPQVQAQMEALGYFENTRQIWLKQRFAHHVGVLARKEMAA